MYTKHQVSKDLFGHLVTLMVQISFAYVFTSI